MKNQNKVLSIAFSPFQISFSLCFYQFLSLKASLEKKYLLAHTIFRKIDICITEVDYV